MRISEIASPSIPTKSFAKLFHVGTMNAGAKGQGSYEGSGLSVSLHPEEWMRIAEIGGQVWLCVRPGNRFVDFLRLSKRQRAMIGDWAVEAGLAQRASVWRVNFVDDETDEERFFTFSDQDEAQREADDLDTTPVEVKGALLVTPALSGRMMQNKPEAGHAADLVVVAYAEDVLKVDGVWWNERLDVSALSAPRGVIVPSMIPHWKITKT